MNGVPLSKNNTRLTDTRWIQECIFIWQASRESVCKTPPGLERPAHPKQSPTMSRHFMPASTPIAWILKDLIKRNSNYSMGELTYLFWGFNKRKTRTSAGIFLSQDKYVKDILNKFDFRTIKPASTPIEAHKSLGKDEERFQVTPKVSHLHAVKRIFRYLKHQPTLGLWYPKDSPFHLEAFSDSDYAGDNHDRRSTSGGCQYLGRRLVSWQCKKQTIVAISSTEAEYVAAASCCAQVLWMQNQLLDYGFNFMNTEIHIDNESTICIVKNPVFHSKTKHIQIRHHFIRDCYEQRLINVVKVHTDDNVADLLTKGFDLARFNFLVHWQQRRNIVQVLISRAGKFLRRDAQGTPTQSAAQASLSTAQDTAGTQGTANLQDTAEVQGTDNSQGTANLQADPFFEDIVDKDAAVTPEMEKKKKNPQKEEIHSQQIRALETTNDEEVARKIQAEWDVEEERKRFDELKKVKPKTTLRKPTSLAQERNQMMNFLKGQGYKNLQKLKYPQMKELYDKF
ncbi:hypothetical protein Tco_0495667 [Tanacetum coccineum]